jgi:predicted DNA-binding transcriptional regulator YafY
MDYLSKSEETICIDNAELVERLNLSSNEIRKYLDELLEKTSLQKVGEDCYKSGNSSKDFSTLSLNERLFISFIKETLPDDEKNLFNSLEKMPIQVLNIGDKFVSKAKDKLIFIVQTVKEAIQGNLYIEKLVYRTGGKKNLYEHTLAPIKIYYTNKNWYLLAVANGDNSLSKGKIYLFQLEHITYISLSTEKFDDFERENLFEYIQQFDKPLSASASIGQEPKKVTLKASSRLFSYFIDENRKISPTQKLIKREDDGFVFEISYYSVGYAYTLIMKYMPHIEFVSAENDVEAEKILQNLSANLGHILRKYNKKN